MPTLPRYLKKPSWWEQSRAVFVASLNFYRVHMMCFTFIPLIFSGIFYACNTTYHIKYVDCLFLCVSSMCVTGLATVDLSSLSTFQQFLMYFQMLIGSLIFVSIIMLSVRKRFFRLKFKHVMEEQRSKRRFDLAKTFTNFPTTTGQMTSALRRRFTRHHDDTEEENHSVPPTPAETIREKDQDKPKKRKGPIKLTTDMIRRVDGGGVGMVNPMGWYDANTPTPGNQTPETNRSVSPRPMSQASSDGREPSQTGSISDPQTLRNESDQSDKGKDESRSSSEGGKKAERPSDDLQNAPSLLKNFGEELRTAPTRTENSFDSEPSRPPQSPRIAKHVPVAYKPTPAEDDAFPRSKTIAFDEPEDGMDHELHFSNTRDPWGTGSSNFPRSTTIRSDNSRFPRSGTTGSGFPRTSSLNRTGSRLVDSKMTGFGGFPTPLEIASDLFHKVFPRAHNKVKRTITIPRTETISGHQSNQEGRDVPYISFAATVGRNSNFQDLTEEQREELGGAEYRALKILWWIVSVYWIFMPLAGATIIAPYIAAGNRYDWVFNEQHKHVRIPWFAFFQATSSFSNTGMSLVDKSMVPFQKAYLMAAVQALLILFGNTCFPILLRFIIWSIYKLAPTGSHVREPLKFLLDHPRRCFVYLFPSTHTWFLLLVVLTLTLIDWVSFMVLDIGTPDIEALPVGTRIAAGLFQSVAVRAAGFGIVPMNSLAPSVKVLYIIMMYISVYPIAMSVRATNVYEERSLGLFDDDDSDEEDEEEQEASETKGAHAVAKYVGWHARRQLAFDMWWIALALWLVCIIERGNLNRTDNAEWFNTFNVIFELVSAYGTVGLSLGAGNQNYSLSGELRTLSKLVIIVVMIRGRHRGLPVAIDRAVMLPRDFQEEDERQLESRLRRSRSRMTSTFGDRDQVLSQTGSVFPRTFTMQSTPATNIVPPSPLLPRRDSAAGVGPTSPGMGPQHVRSFSNSSDVPAPMSPQSPGLHFALQNPPRHIRSHSHSSNTASSPPIVGANPNSLNINGLDTVEETGLSRLPTLTLSTSNLARSASPDNDAPPLTA